MRAWVVISGCLLLALATACAKRPERRAETPKAQRQFREQPADHFNLPAGTERMAVTMHRPRAGEPDEDGWCLAESTEGGFSVKLPTLFNDFTMSGKTANGGVAKKCIVSAKTQGGTAYSVTAVTSTDEKTDPDFVGSFWTAFEGRAKEKQRVTHAGMAGVQFRFVNADSAGTVRAFQNGSTGYMLVVDYQAGPDWLHNVEQDAITFFESFRLK